MLRWSRRLTRAGATAAFVVVVLALTAAGAVPTPAAASESLTLVSATRATTSGAVSLTISRPTVSTGNLLLAAIDARVSGTAAIVAPAGWALVRRDSVASGSQSLSQALFYKIAGSAEPISYTWSLGEKASVAGAIVAYSGVDTSYPIDAHSGTAVASARSVAAPAIATRVPNELVVGVFGDASGKQITPPSRLTERYEVAARSGKGDLGPGTEGADGLFAAAGSTGSLTASAGGGTTALAGQLVALRPAVVVAAPPVNTVPPAIAGTPQVGSTLTGSPGTWTSSGSLVYAYQWKQCDSAGANCANVSGASTSAYTLASGDQGHTMRVLVTATNSGGSAAAQSAASAVVAAAPAPSPSPSPTPTPAPTDRWFATDSPFNTPIAAGAEVDAGSQAMVQNLVSESQKSGWPISVKRWSTPVYYADGSTPKQNVAMTASWAAASTLYGVPVPAEARPDPSSDGHMAIINRDNGCYYEFYRAARAADGTLSAGWGNRELLNGSGVYPHSWSTRDSGFANFSGLIRPEELQAGTIEHALAFSTMYTLKGDPVPPATSSGGAPLTAPAGTLPIPYGARLQLDPNLNLDSLNLAPWQRTVARALQKYGMYMADTGGFGLGAVNPQSYPTNPYTPYWGDGDYAYLPTTLVPYLRVLKLPPSWHPASYVIADSPCGTLK